MTLTTLEIKSLSCPENKKQFKKFDSNGLFLLIKASGTKHWRMKFMFGGKHQEISFGKYPIISLKKAREFTNEARLQLAQGINPAVERRKAKNKNSDSRTFLSVAMTWFDKQKNNWSEDHARRVHSKLLNDTKPIAKISIDGIDSAKVIALLIKIESTANSNKARVIFPILNRIFSYALAHRYITLNPVQGLALNDILTPAPKVKHFSAITDSEALGELIRSIDEKQTGNFCTIEALKLIPRIFLRPKEVRFLKWEYVNFEKQIIEIPADDMKKSRPHLVPLADQVIKQLTRLKTFTGYSQYLFPSIKNSDNPISKNVLTNSLRSLGYTADVMTAHGFRSSASTILHEQGWHHDIIETQLAHLIGTSTSRAYNRSIYLAERIKMMQDWSNYLDKIKVY